MPRYGGLAHKGTRIAAVRELTRSELSTLRIPRPEKPILQRLRDPHHLLARLIASGLTLKEAAHRGGFSYQRAMDLEKDPSFRDLILHYREIATQGHMDAFDEFTELAVGNMVKAERMLAERIEEVDDEGDKLPVRDLINIVSDRADRFGYGKKQTNLNVNVDMAAKLEAMIKRSGMSIVGRLADASQRPVQQLRQSSQLAQPAPAPLRRI